MPLPFGPFDVSHHPVTAEVRRAVPPRAEVPGSLFLETAWNLYRLVLTRVDGPRCAHRPSCSRYGVLAVRAHGALGLLLTYDRLLRGSESSALRPLPTVFLDGERYVFDPLKESTFWLR
jgi:hypothetical protein